MKECLLPETEQKRVKEIVDKRQSLVEQIFCLIKDTMEENGKNLTIDYVEGILEQACNTLHNRSYLLPIKLILKEK